MEIDCPRKCGAKVKLERIWHTYEKSPYRAVKDHYSAAGVAKGINRKCVGSGVHVRTDER